MSDINDYLEQHKKFRAIGGGYLVKEHAPTINCDDGFSMSVQASNGHYCKPRGESGPYTHVEVGFPNREDSLLLPYAESPSDPTGTVYGYVPISVVEQVIDNHGGMAKE